MIPYGRQHVTEEDIDAVVEVLHSDFLTQGPCVPAFEQAFAVRVTADYAVASNSATSSLHLAYLALGIGAGDVVWTVPITFVATANAARMCGADVGFVDIDADTFCMDVGDLADRLVRARKDGGLPSLVVPVHFAGRSCDMEAIGGLAREFGFRVVEDAAHAVGADDGTQPIGACRHSDIAIFSFHPVKIITTGEGGLATTNDGDLAERMRMLGTHGITREAASMAGGSEGGWYYQQVELGYNYRMTDIQAALGLSQLSRLDSYLRRRRELVRRYDSLLADFPLARPDIGCLEESAWHLYVIRLAERGPGRAEVFEHLRENGVGVQVHYIPVHLQPYYRALGFTPGEFPVAESYYSRALSLPLFPSMTDADQDQVVETLRRTLDALGAA